MFLEEAYRILENYYYQIDNYNQDSNFSDYNIDTAYIKDILEKIFSNNFELTDDNIETLIEILNDVNDPQLIEAINTIKKYSSWKGVLFFSFYYY